MRKALQRLVFYALLLPVFISSAAFAQTSPVYPVNSTPKDFEVDSLAPKKGPAWGGTTITIYGKKFLPNTTFEVRFGGIPGTKVTRIDNQTLTVKSPRHPLSIKNTDTLEVTVTDLSETPNVTKVSPDSFIYVRPGTKLSLLPVSAYYNGNIELNATLTDSAGIPLDSQTVTFTLGGLLAGTAMTDSNGSARLPATISGVSIGIHSGYIEAGFAENFYYKSSTAQAADLTVKPIPTALTVNSPVINYGESIEFKAVLTSSGAPLPGKTVNFTLNNNPAGSAVTQNDGSAALPLSQSPDAGSYSIKTVFTETGYDTSSASGTLTVNKAPTNLIVNNVDADGSTVTLKARLTSNVTGLGIPNDTVSFSFNGGPDAGFAVTDQNGVAEVPGVTVPGNLGPGLHKGAIKASFAGSKNYIASSGSGDLTIKKTNTVLSVSSATGTYGGSVSLKAQLKSGGSNLAGQTIKFYLNDIPAGQSSTGSDGIANYTAALGTIDAGTYPEGVKAVFEGSDIYGPDTAVNSLTVAQATTQLSLKDAEAGYGTSVTLTAILTSSVTQLGIADKSVNFVIQGGPQITAVTNVSGVASASVDLGTTSAGTHDITAAFSPAGGNYTGSTGKGTLTVKGYATSLAVTNVTGSYGGTVTLEAALTSSGAGLQAKTIKFTFNNKTYSAETDMSGIARIGGVSISGFEAGTYPGVIAAEFAGSGGYGYSSASGSLTVDKAATMVTVANATGSSGGKIDLSATLTSSGTKLKGLTIKFELNGNPAVEAITNDFGVATVYGADVPVGLITGPHYGAIAAVFAGSSNYSPSQGSATLTITQIPTAIQVTKATGPYGGKVNLSARLTGSSGIPLSSMKLHFKLNGADINDAYTDENGMAVLAGVSIAGIDAGVHDNYIQASFSPENNNYAPSNAYGPLEVTPAATAMNMSNMDADFGSTVTLTAKLLSFVTGKGIEGRTIIFKVDGAEAGSATTDADGKASKSYYLGNTSPGDHAVEAFFSPPGGNYSGCSGKAVLNVKAASTALMVTNVTGAFGSTVTLEAVLTSSGAPLSGMTVSFSINGKSAGSAATGSNGKAALQFSLAGIDAGFYPGAIKADFNAQGNYSSSTGSGSLTVNQAPTAIVVPKAIGTYNGKVSLTAKLSAASNGSALSDRTIYFRLNGMDKGSAVTDYNGLATLNDVSIAGLPVGTYNDYIEAVFSPSGGNYLSSSGKGPLEVDLASTNLTVDKVSAVYGSRVSLMAKLTSQGTPLSGKVIEFSLNNISVGNAVTDVNGLAVKTNVGLSGIAAGVHTGYIGAVFKEAASYKGSSSTSDLEITKASTAVSVLPAEVQYSDQVTLTAVVTSLSAQEILNAAGGIVEFRYQVENETAQLLSTVNSFSVVNGSLNFNYTFACTLAPGTYKIIAAFTPAAKNNFEGSCSTAPWGPLIVKPEDVLIEYIGPRYFVTPSLSDFNTLLNFCAALTDMPDGSRGNITKAKVEFREVAIDGSFDNGTIRGKDLPVLLLNQADATTGTAANPSFKRNLSQAEINNEGATFSIYTSAGGCYYGLSDPALVTIAIPGKSDISGGGFIIPNSSAGKYRSQAGTKNGFGFSMKYNTSGSNFPGQANIVIRGEDNKIYLIKSGLISSVSAYTIKNMPGKAASFSAKADLKDLTDPRNPVILATGLSLSLEVYDDDKNNENDALAITLRDNNSVLLYSSNWDGSNTFSQTLAAPKGGGVISVLNLSGPVSVEAGKIIPKEYALYQNFPNPFNPSTNIQFDLPEDSRVNISIYNILGREVARLVSEDLPAGKHQAVWNSQDGGSFASGMYILRISAKSLSSEKSLISTKKMLLVK